jgi:hypothetical protein
VSSEEADALAAVAIEHMNVLAAAFRKKFAIKFVPGSTYTIGPGAPPGVHIRTFLNIGRNRLVRIWQKLHVF